VTRLASALATLAFAALARGPTARANPLPGSPTVGVILPRGGQRGSEMEIVFHGDRLADAAEVMFIDPGLTVVSLTPNDEKKVTAKIQIAADAALGEHRLRLRTKSGISELRTFWVGPFPSVQEKEPNNDLDHAQPIERNVTVEGVVTNEDVDLFSIEMKAGERLTAEVEGLRLGETLFDPFVAILDAKRFELASCDDCALLKQDPFASCVVPADGRYFVLIRETSYRGGDRSRYRMHVGTFPRPTVASPAGGKAGSDVELKLLGDVKGDVVQKVHLAPDAPSDSWYVPEQDGVSAPSGVALRVVNAEPIPEAEPNDDFAHATAAGKPPPLAFDGVIDHPGDVDVVKFSAKANAALNVRLHGRSVRSPLDSVITIHSADGKQLDASDDTIGLDSYLRFVPPADGDYFVRISDHLGAGGPLYVWRLVVSPVTPSLALDLPRFGRDSQARQTLSIARGNRGALVVHCGRNNFAGEVKLAAEGLPDGVKVTAVPMAKAVDTTLLLFEAAADAPLSGRFVDLIGEFDTPQPADHPDAPVPPPLKGHLRQRFELVVAQPNDTNFYDTSVDRLPVAVTEEVPFTLEVETPKVPLVQGGAQQLRVHAKRNAGYDEPIVVRMLWLPPGIGAQPTQTIEKGKSDLLYGVNAAGDAPPTTWQLALQGEAESGRGQVFASTALTPLTVTPPFLNLKLDLAATEQGKPVQVVAHLEPVTPFEGKAVVKLHGLPPKCSAPDQEIAASDTSVVFEVATAADTPAGKHTSLFCEVDVVKEGETIVHYLGGGGTLRVDPPAPPKPVAAAAPQKQEAPKPPAEKKAKPLSRLEQLRLEAKQKEQAAAPADAAKPADAAPPNAKPQGGGR
jgi:pre-peptidase